MLLALQLSVLVVVIETIGAIVASVALGSMAGRRPVEPLILAGLLGIFGLAIEAAVVLVALVRSRGREMPHGRAARRLWGWVLTGTSIVTAGIALFAWRSASEDQQLCRRVAVSFGFRPTDSSILCHRDLTGTIGWSAVAGLILVAGVALLAAFARDGPD